MPFTQIIPFFYYLSLNSLAFYMQKRKKLSLAQVSTPKAECWLGHFTNRQEKELPQKLLRLRVSPNTCNR